MTVFPTIKLTMPDGKEVVLDGYIDGGFIHVEPPPPPPKTSFEGTCTVTRLEPDDEFRKRLLYVAAGDRRNLDRLSVARGAELDAIAEEFGLRRRKGKEVSSESFNAFVEDLKKL